MPEDSDSNSIHPVHDRFVKDFLREPAEAAALFQCVLPKSLAKQLSWQDLRQEPCEFIDQWLGQKNSDLLFSIPFGTRTLNLFLLFEHLSNPDKNIPFRVLQYQVAAWSHQLKAGKLPGPIVGVVLYHGKQPWNAPANISRWLRLSQKEELEVGAFVPRFEFVFVDLSRIDVDGLEMRAYSKMVLSLLKSMGDGTELRWLDRNARFLEELLGQPEKDVRVRTLLRYCLEASPRLDYGAFQAKLNGLESEQFKKTIMSIADMLMERGLEQGLEQGLERGLEQGLEQGLERGELIGRIQTLERILKLAISDKQELHEWTLAELEERAEFLDRQL